MINVPVFSSGFCPLAHLCSSPVALIYSTGLYTMCCYRTEVIVFLQHFKASMLVKILASPLEKKERHMMIQKLSEKKNQLVIPKFNLVIDICMSIIDMVKEKNWEKKRGGEKCLFTGIPLPQ